MMTRRIFLLLLLAGSLAACQKSDLPDERMEELQCVNFFARNMLSLYYLWNEEIRQELDRWSDTGDPVGQVRRTRYKRGDTEVDRWTNLYPDFDAFYAQITGKRKSFGMDFSFYPSGSGQVALVNYTYDGGPAGKAGLRRGDIIMQVDGQAITADNQTRVNEILRQGERVRLTLRDGSDVVLEAVEMYEDPILATRVFGCGDKAVGYLHFSAFTLDACADLVRVCREFRESGITELILDLRYNGGGFVFTEQVLASLLAPREEVLAGSLFSTEVFNSSLTEYYERDGRETRSFFQTQYVRETGERYNTLEANIGIQHLYVITGAGCASASEALICNLYPFLPITLVGTKTHGKYCTGMLMEGPEFYKKFAGQLDDRTVERGKALTRNWGLYLMYSRFADRDGTTRCMPDGLTPDYEVRDNPLDGYELGDPRETLLSATLALCGYTPLHPESRSAGQAGVLPDPLSEPIRPDIGWRIRTP